MEGSKITRNSLSAKQMRALGDWLEVYPCATAQIKASSLAKEASAALGFAVTPRNIQTAAKVVDVKIWTRPVKPKPVAAADPELFTLQDIGRRLADLERKVAQMAGGT